MSKTHVVWHEQRVTREDREALKGQRGCVVWFTGLSGCGKSTIANEVDHRLHQLGVHTYLLDGDNVRHGLNASPAMLMEAHGEQFGQRFGLGFAAEDREENIRRIGAVAQLFCDAGLIVLTAFVSPYRRDREAVRQRLAQSGSADDFIEVFVDAPLAVCEARDPKGLYKKARAGEIPHFTGVNDPYEPPLAAELTLDSALRTPAELAQEVIAHLRKLGKIPPGS
jgi:adenylylsulfate kinase